MTNRNQFVFAFAILCLGSACDATLTRATGDARSDSSSDSSLRDGSHFDARLDSNASDSAQPPLDGTVDPEFCPESTPEVVNRPIPTEWSEGQCIVKWDANDGSVFRAHYFEPGHYLYADQHLTNGNRVFASAALLGNLNVSRQAKRAFCQTQPTEGGCDHLAVPNCAMYRAMPSCSTIFIYGPWQRPIRLRKAGDVIWGELQFQTGGDWQYVPGNFLDQASGQNAGEGFPVQDTGAECFSLTENAPATPEACS